MPLANRSNSWILPLSLLLLAAAGGVAYELLRLISAEKLWGYRPLLLYGFAWSGLVLLIIAYRQKKGKTVSWRRLGLSTLSGLILALAFPGFLPFPWLLFVGFIPLLLVHRELAALREKGIRARFFPYAYHTFFIWNAVATFWVTNTALAAGLFAVIVNALLMCIPVLLFQWTHRIWPRFALVSFIAYWITFEYLHMHWDLSWPWLTLGNAFAQMHPTVQWYEYTGVFGGSLWILLMNMWLLRFWEQGERPAQITIRQWGITAALILLPVALSLGIYLTYTPVGEEREVLAIQTNFEPHFEKFDAGSRQSQTGKIYELIESGITETTDYVVLPETVFDLVERDQVRDFPAIAQLTEALSDHPGLEFVTGLGAYHILRPDEAHSRATREQTDSKGQVFFWESYNAAAQVTVGSDEVQFYKKSKLVPGAESFPFPWLFFFMEPVVEQLGGTTSGFGMQAERTPFTGPKGRIAPVICYESIYGEYFAGYIRPPNRAQAAFIMTNDGWWDNTQGHRQHLYFASLRAIETRRSIARAANVGKSAFIDQRGDRLQVADYGEGRALNGTIRLNDALTFYVKWGDMIARIALYLSLLLIVGTIARRLKKEDGNLK